MRLSVNRQTHEVTATCLSELVTELQLPDRGIAVACSGEVVPRSQWPTYALVAEMHIEILEAAAGG